MFFLLFCFFSCFSSSFHFIFWITSSLRPYINCADTRVPKLFSITLASCYLQIGLMSRVILDACLIPCVLSWSECGEVLASQTAHAVKRSQCQCHVNVSWLRLTHITTRQMKAQTSCSIRLEMCLKSFHTKTKHSSQLIYDQVPERISKQLVSAAWSSMQL